ncbi:MAG: right-handed parallel beta-helix repeat-containing protein [candidate division WOR-3 bacterium]|nr:right-handed parallel beta-helix repeat-containing protein [candidate division WOR-3 bacterium]
METEKYLIAIFLSSFLWAYTYNVGPGMPYDSIGAVPLESLNPGDTVKIHYRSNPYREKWVIARAGTQNAPIVFYGVPSSSGALPVIDGRNAVTRLQLDYWSENRGIINVGGSSIPNQTPSYIIIENLEIRSARPPYTFYDDQGQLQSYASNASTIYVVAGSNITIRNCILHDCGNGFFVAYQGRNILVEGCYIYDNGIENSIYEHNNYTEAQGIIFQYNYFSHLRSGCPGNNLKDRSSGCIIRYNWIEYGNRQLDLVDSDHPEIYNDTTYRKTFVYGNVLIEQIDEGNSQIVHYGGDSGDTTRYRQGRLYFYNNTVVSKRSGNTTLFRLSTNRESCDARNNIFYVTAAGNRLAMLAEYGLLISRHNWLKPNWVISHSTFQGTFVDSGGIITGTSPGFVDFNNEDFHLLSSSPCRNAGTSLAPQVLPHHNVIYQYVKHRLYESRPNDGIFDIGAFEYTSGGLVDEVTTRKINCLRVILIKKNVFQFVFFEPYTLKFYDSEGRIIYDAGRIDSDNYIWDGNRFPAGVYFFVCYTAKNSTNVGKVVLVK